MDINSLFEDNFLFKHSKIDTEKNKLSKTIFTMILDHYYEKLSLV